MGERTLLATLLSDAIECYCKHLRPKNRHQRQLFHEAETWIMGEDEVVASHPGGSAHAFSFPYVCEVLDIDADYLRGGLRRWRDTHLQHG